MSLLAREYSAPRGLGAVPGSHHMNDFIHTYYPPPPLQQQYSHSQRQSAYPGTQMSLTKASYEVGPTPAFASHNNDSDPLEEPDPIHQSQLTGNRPYSPFGSTTPLAPLSRLNTGSSQATSFSTTQGMSNSMSMLPPGYGRDNYVPPASGNAHSRAHSRAQSMTGSLLGLTSQPRQDSVSHPRTYSVSHLSESGRTMSANTASSGNIAPSGVFSPPASHSRAGSLSGSTSSPSPSAAAFNFFSGPATQVHGGSSMHSSITSTTGNNSSRIAPIGRPNHSKQTNVDHIGTSRKYNGATSSITSPLSNDFEDGWLNDKSASSVETSSTINENRKSASGVWN